MTATGTPGGDPGTGKDQGPDTQTETKPSEKPKPTEIPEEYRHLVDQAVTKGIKTREAALKRQAEEERAKASGDLEAQLKAEREARQALELKQATSEILAEEGLPFLGKVFDMDLSTAEGRRDAVKATKKALAAQVEAAVAERLKTAKPAKGVEGGPPKKPHEMTPEEWAEDKKRRGIAG